MSTEADRYLAARSRDPKVAVLEEGAIQRPSSSTLKSSSLSTAHGTMIGDATQPAWNSNLFTVACPCGVVFERWVTPEDAELDCFAPRD